MMECRTPLPHQSHPISTHPLLECRPCQLTDTVQIISSGLCQRIRCHSQRADLKHLGTCSFTQHNCQPLKVIVSSPFLCFFDQCSHPYMDCGSVTYARDESMPFAWPPAPSVKGSVRGTTCQEAGNRNKLRQTPLPALSMEAIFGGTILRVALLAFHILTFQHICLTYCLH